MTAAPKKDTAERLHSLRIVRDDEQSSTRGSRWRLPLLLLAVFAGGVGAAIWFPDAFDRIGIQRAAREPSGVTSEPAHEPVTAAAPTPARASAQLTMSGYLVARTSVEVAAEVPSVLLALHVDDGDRVSAGTLIAELDGSLAATAFAIAKAEASAAEWAIEVLQAELVAAETARDRTRTLSERGLSSQATMDNAEATAIGLSSRLSEAIARRDIAALEAERAGLLLEQYRLAAPIDGTITGCVAQVGETISPGNFDDGDGGGICTIVDFSSIVIEIDVPEIMIRRVLPGAMAVATLDAYPDDPLEAVVQSIAPIANRAKSTIQARLTFTGPEDPRLRPNMAVTVRLEEQ
ncbi:MAG: efflux RND transporter periplasmic adaptor subunit [Pseudomonadota bacterium]